MILVLGTGAANFMDYSQEKEKTLSYKLANNLVVCYHVGKK